MSWVSFDYNFFITQQERLLDSIDSSSFTLYQENLPDGKDIFVIFIKEDASELGHTIL
jgi:hypothetical protein